MSILKKLNIKERISKSLEFFNELVFVKRSLHAFGASLLLSCIIVQTSTPFFSVSSTLMQADTSTTSTSMDLGAATALFGGASNDKAGPADEFRSNMNSYLLAQRMWNKGWGSKIFGNGDMNEEYFNKIPKRHTIPDRVVAFMSGYDLYDYFSAYDLQGFIQSTIEVPQRPAASNVVLLSKTQDKDFAIEFMNAVILETDQYAKERLILKSNEIISATYSQLAISKNSMIASALASTINSEYFKIANLDNDLPHLLDVIDPPHSSEYPIAPKVSAIFISNAIIFLFVSILFSFIQKNKEDLW
ncbi:hypothetical protein OAW69_01160 [Gammaproteobacteria bacterium]|nr:hypothetical protein [Gammaproteobacteria bacterium]